LNHSVPMLTALAQAIEARDPFARGHAARVTALAEIVAQRLGWDESDVARLRMGGLLHDIGKLAVQVDVLRKPAALTVEEKAQMRAHPAVGAGMLQQVEEARGAVPCVLFHHERWDGRGYPYGRRGEEIPVEARLLAIADAFDAMTCFRPYRPIVEPGAAIDEIIACAGGQFDPRLAWVFVEAWESGELAAARVTRAAAS
jgi:putative nucleotidyltransferase with HDIG domain